VARIIRHPFSHINDALLSPSSSSPASTQWNLLWSLLYNCLGIPIAAGVFYPVVHTRLPPTVAAIAMALSSISVVLSSLSLRLYEPPDLDPTRRRRRSRQIRRWLWRDPTSSDTTGHNDDDDDGSSANSLSVNLLENDHLMGSSEMDQTESTRCIDNRTNSLSRLEEGGEGGGGDDDL